MKKLFLLLFTFLMLAAPANARHLAVFELNDPHFYNMWQQQSIQPDVLVVGKDWRYLDEFLKKTQDKFNNDSEELLIDISCHGSAKNGMLYLDGKHKTSMGSVIKHVEDFFPNRPNLTLVFESCYAGRCYKLTSRGNKDADLPGGITTPPSFPVYGIDDTMPNAGNLQYLSYINHDTTYQMDIREYEVKPLHESYHRVDWEFLLTVGQKMIEFWQNLISRHTL